MKAPEVVDVVVARAPVAPRLPLARPLSRMQLAVAVLLAEGRREREIARLLGVEITTVWYHLAEAAARIPGTLPRGPKVVAWVRGASREVLVGEAGQVPIAVALQRALSITRGRGCPACGYLAVQQVDPEPRRDS